MLIWFSASIFFFTTFLLIKSHLNELSSEVPLSLSTWIVDMAIQTVEMKEWLCVSYWPASMYQWHFSSVQFNSIQLFEFFFIDLGSFSLTSDGVDCAVYSFTVQSSIHTKVITSRRKNATHSLRSKKKKPTKLFLNTQVIQKCYSHTRTRQIDHMTHTLTHIMI